MGFNSRTFDLNSITTSFPRLYVFRYVTDNPVSSSVSYLKIRPLNPLQLFASAGKFLNSPSIIIVVFSGLVSPVSESIIE